MRAFKFSIRSVLLGIAYLALSLGCIRYAGCHCWLAQQCERTMVTVACKRSQQSATRHPMLQVPVTSKLFAMLAHSTWTPHAAT